MYQGGSNRAALKQVLCKNTVSQVVINKEDNKVFCENDYFSLSVDSTTCVQYAIMTRFKTFQVAFHELTQVIKVQKRK